MPATLFALPFAIIATFAYPLATVPLYTSIVVPTVRYTHRAESTAMPSARGALAAVTEVPAQPLPHDDGDVA